MKALSRELPNKLLPGILVVGEEFKEYDQEKIMIIEKINEIIDYVEELSDVLTKENK